MSKTTASTVAALVLVIASVSLAAMRRHALGPEVDGPRGTGAWRVTLTAQGRLAEGNRAVSLALPRDFRRQHIYQERYRSKELVARVPRRKVAASRSAVWRPREPGKVSDFRVSYSFSTLLPIAEPTPGMNRLTALLDAPPTGPVRSGKVENKEIARQIRSLTKEGMKDRDKARAFYDFASEFENEPAYENKTAARTLRDRSGDSGGKARLLVALCRAAGIHARLVKGIVLEPDNSSPPLHHWAEAWLDNRWLPMDATRHAYGENGFPNNYLVLRLGDRKIVASKGTNINLVFQAEHLPNPSETDASLSSGMKRFWHRLSLHGLRPAEQNLVRFLLLLPLAALIVAIFRTVIGVPTFGTFAPALLGLAFPDMRAMRWGLPIFVILVLTGWGMRHWLERFHLLQVARISALLTLVVIVLLIIIVAASNAGVATTQYIALLPLVILTHLVERFWTIEAEDGPVSSFRTLLGTVVVSVAVSLCLIADAVSAWMFRYPETLGVVLATQFLLGRYTGYRLSELYRFGDLLRQEQPASGTDNAESDKQKSKAAATVPEQGGR